MIGLVSDVGESGFGVVGRNLVLAFEALGLPPVLWSRDYRTARDYGPAFDRALDRAGACGPLAVLRVGNPGCMEFFPSQTTCRMGYVFFEGTRFSDYEWRCVRALDVAFVPSAWAARVCALNGVDPARVRLAMPGVDPAVFAPAPAPARPETGLPRVTEFLAVGKAEPRKGQDFALRAFDAAFQEADAVRLTLACENPLVLPGYDGPALTRRLREAAADSRMGRVGKVRVLGRVKTQAELAALMRAADCGVFLSRAEGFNLPLAEMLALGKPCVATHAAAHQSFAGPAGARLVHCPAAEPFDDPLFPGGVAGAWARLGDAELGQAAAHLRALHEEASAGRTPKAARTGPAYFARRTWRHTAAVFARFIGWAAPEDL